MTSIKNSTYLFNYNSNKDNDREIHSYWLDTALTRKYGIDTNDNISQLEFTRLCHGIDPNGKSQFRNSIEDFKEWHKQDMRKDELLKQKNSSQGLSEQDQAELRKLGSLRQMGWQCSFHATKSLAIAYELGNDQFKDTIDACMRKAFDRVGEEMTNDIKGHKDKGANKGRGIAGLAIGVHIHRSNRAQDPSLHGHMSIPNFALGEDGKIKTISNWTLCKNYHKYSALFRSELAKELQKQGIGIEADKDYSFRVKAIPKELEQHFNKRTSAIDKALEKHCQEHGINIDSMSDKERSLLRDRFAMELRENKTDTTMRDKVHRWKQEVHQLGYSIEGINQEVNKKDFSQIENRSNQKLAIDSIMKELDKLYGAKGKPFTDKALDRIINDKKQFYDFDHEAIKEKILEECFISHEKGINKKNGKEYSYVKISLKGDKLKELGKGSDKKIEIELIKLKEPVKAPSKINQPFIDTMKQIPKKTHIDKAFAMASKAMDSNSSNGNIGGGTTQGGNTNALSGKEKFLAIAHNCKAQAYELNWKAQYTKDDRERANLLSQAGMLMQQADDSYYQGLQIGKNHELGR